MSERTGCFHCSGQGDICGPHQGDRFSQLTRQTRDPAAVAVRAGGTPGAFWSTTSTPRPTRPCTRRSGQPRRQAPERTARVGGPRSYTLPVLQPEQVVPRAESANGKRSRPRRGRRLPGQEAVRSSARPAAWLVCQFQFHPRPPGTRRVAQERRAAAVPPRGAPLSAFPIAGTYRRDARGAIVIRSYLCLCLSLN